MRTAVNQRTEPFVEPPRETIPGISRRHVATLEVSDADADWVRGNQHLIVLRTLGRKSAKEHKVALPYWLDPDGHRILVASFAGAPRHPHWYLNLADRTANPEVLVRAQKGSFWAEAQVLEGEDYDRTWAALTADRAHYIDYQTRTDRKIPLVRLIERRSA
jgi:deazaflavin-dependent oxidoreductase (nitroreductase family)